MAPEQATGQTVDGRCDLFSLGCVMYRMAAGDMPFHGNDSISTLMAVVNHQPAPTCCAVNPRVSQALLDLIMGLLEKKPDDRPQSAEAVAEQLVALAAPGRVRQVEARASD